MFDDINDLYQQVILDHCKQPRNFHEMPAATCSAQGRNPICGDQLRLFLTVENGVMLAAVALTTYGMPLVVELGIFFDVMVAVMVLGILVYRIRETFASMDTGKLDQLKG